MGWKPRSCESAGDKLAKKRVRDLAKEMGKTSREMVKILKELGFDKVKTAQTTLDDADIIQIQARLEVYGMIPSAKETQAEKPAQAIQEKEEETSGKAQAATETLEAPSGVEAPETGPASAAPPPSAGEEPAPEEVAGKEKEEEGLAAQAPEEKPQAQEAQAPSVEAPPPGEAAPAQAGPEEKERGEAQAAPPEKVTSQGSPPVPEEKVAEAGAAQGSQPAAQTPAAQGGGSARAESPPKTEPPPSRRRLRPKRKGAQILGRIELPQEVRSDAARRSRPLSEVEAERNLRERALQNIRTRAARSPVGGGRGEPHRGGRHGQGRGGGTGTAWPGFGRRQGGGKNKLLPKKKTTIRPSPTVDPSKPVVVSPPVSVKDLSQALGIKVSDLLRVLMLDLKVTAQINSFLENHVVELAAEALGRKVVFKETLEAEEELFQEIEEGETSPENLVPRPPIITVLGHVDHGKTSLLDRIREANVAASEAGGITQHIGAYRILTGKGQEIVVIDTPGHEAFTQMRARGAQVTDIAVLVVAADDGVMPTTEEAINHAKAAGVPIVVAINKVDKPGANPMRAMQQLASLGLNPEEWGGTVGMVQTSAVTGQGIQDLLDRIVLEAEVLDLKADPTLPAKGTVLEAKQTPEEGTVVTFLVQNGTLHKGDNVLCGATVGRIRLIKDDLGRTIPKAPPSWPVQVVGLPELPEAGEKFYVTKDVKKARAVAEKRRDQEREKRLAEKSIVTLETLSEQLRKKEIQALRVILKVDVKGSLEPLKHSITQLKHEEVEVEVLHAAVGAVTEADVDLAEASGAIIIAFNVQADELARSKSEERGVQIAYFDVIYDVIDAVKSAVEGKLKPIEKEIHLGKAEVRKVFKFQKRSIAGCFVQDGVVQRNAQVRLLRDGKELFKGRLSSLRREKDDVREVKAGFECGLMLDGWDDIREGDTLECFEIQLERRTL